jgi:uncharacterized protein DUF4349
MSLPDAIVNELKTARIVPSPELRERVREIASRPPDPPRTRSFAWPPRRVVLVAVPACLAIAVASAVAVGLVKSGEGERAVAPPTVAVTHGERGATPGGAGGTADDALTLQSREARKAPAPAPYGLPTSRERAQLYTAELRLQVKDVSTASKRALRLTQSLGGYVRTVNVGDEGGTIVVRIPVGSVQAAIVKFSALGKILDQNVSIVDVQPQLDARFRQMQQVRKEIAKLQARLATPGLSADERERIAGEIADYRAQLVALQKAQAEQQKQTSFATVRLALRTPQPEPAAAPGRLDRALDNAGTVLAREAEIALYVLIVAAPLALVAALLLAGERARRRRADERLLAG